MAAQLFQLPVRNSAPEMELLDAFDVHSLAHKAAEHLEAFQRAPWRQLNDSQRKKHLEEAKVLIERIQKLESGLIPMPIWGD